MHGNAHIDYMYLGLEHRMTKEQLAELVALSDQVKTATDALDGAKAALINAAEKVGYADLPMLERTKLDRWLPVFVFRHFLKRKVRDELKDGANGRG